MQRDSIIEYAKRWKAIGINSFSLKIEKEHGSKKLYKKAIKISDEMLVSPDILPGDFNFLGPNSFLAGNSKIGDFCKLSFGTFIMQNGFLCSNIKSMPYTAFYKKYKLPGTYFGNPAKSI